VNFIETDLISAQAKACGEKSMKKSAVIVAAVLSASVVFAHAEEKTTVDMSKLTCGQLTKLGFQDFAGLTMWLSGYYNASVRNTVIDLDQFALAAKTVKDSCQSNPRATVMSTAERALGIKMRR
jgi:HdeA/HdeB family